MYTLEGMGNLSVYSHPPFTKPLLGISENFMSDVFRNNGNPMNHYHIKENERTQFRWIFNSYPKNNAPSVLS